MARGTHEAASPQPPEPQTLAPIWRIEGQRATFAAGTFAGEVAVAHPAQGVAARALGRASLGLDILAVCGPGLADDAHRADCYERGTDLVLTCAETAARPLRVQVYWRVLSADRLPAGAAGIDLQVSAQTSLLDADSSLYAQSSVPARHAARLTDCPADAECWLFRLPGEFSYAEMIHPADARGCELAREDDAPDRWLLRRRLFGERLEKGVILRARLRGILLPSRDDERLAAVACEAFLRQPPPLTT